MNTINNTTQKTTIDHETTSASRSSNSNRELESTSPNSVQYKMFVGGLAKWITEEDLTEYFSKYGEVKKAKILKERNSGNSKGFGFVFFKFKEGLTSSLKFPKKHVIKGRIVDCQEALGLACERDQKKYSQMNRRRVFIGNVSKAADDSDLTEYFSKFGKLKSAYLLKDYKENYTRRYGFIVFRDIAPAVEVVKMREHLIKGKIAICEEYKSKNETMKLKTTKKHSQHMSSQEGSSKRMTPDLAWVEGDFERKKRNDKIKNVAQALDIWHRFRPWNGMQGVLRLNRAPQRCSQGQTNYNTWNRPGRPHACYATAYNGYRRSHQNMSRFVSQKF